MMVSHTRKSITAITKIKKTIPGQLHCFRHLDRRRIITPQVIIKTAIRINSIPTVICCLQDGTVRFIGYPKGVLEFQCGLRDSIRLLSKVECSRLPGRLLPIHGSSISGCELQLRNSIRWLCTSSHSTRKINPNAMALPVIRRGTDQMWNSVQRA